MIEQARKKTFPYKLLADGTIIEIETQKTVGYITNYAELDYAWKRGSLAKKALIKQELGL